MSWANTTCPCGGAKERETMLCQACEVAVAGTFDRREMENEAAGFTERRNAAIRVLAVARRRTNPSLSLNYSL